jgi:hypothetical protein
MISIFSRQKNFDNEWIGHKGLNQLGLHAFRMRLANLCNRLRYAQTGLSKDQNCQTLRQNGFIAHKNFLETQVFETIRAEAEKAVQLSVGHTPISERNHTGFGSKQEHHWGFDRFDGGTLNRFININHDTMPAIQRFTGDTRLSNYSKTITGRTHKPGSIWIYLTVHGDETTGEDLQKNIHRDTFFSSMKFWYFLRPVTLADGPFAYVPKSQMLTKARSKWEQEKALSVIASEANPEIDGSFRIDETDLKNIGYESPQYITVPANTLVIADTLGFHHRGFAKKGKERLALYGNLRPHPFALFPN